MGRFEILDSLMTVDPAFRGSFDELMRINVEARDIDGLKAAMSKWLSSNPTDERVRAAYEQLLKGWSPFSDSTKKP